MILPKRIYVIEEDDGEGEKYLIAFKTLEEIDADYAGTNVGIYFLDKINKFTVTKPIKTLQ